jgi:cell division septum initiation protein DivIVA
MGNSTTPKKVKVKKALWKRILKWSGISFVLLLIIAILIPILFKDRIIQMIKDETNANLNATVDFGEFDLTFLSTFPNLTLVINDVSVIGKDAFEGVALAQIQQTSVTLDFWKVFGGTYQVESFTLTKPIINVKVLPDGKANYDIAIPDTTSIETEEPTSPFQFAVKEYEIINGDITYDDQYYLTYININQINHKGNLTIDDVIYNLSTTSAIENLTFGYDGINYLNNSVSDIDCDIEIAMPENEMKFTFKENNATFNKLGLHFDGWFLMTDELMDMDIKFSTVEQSFKSLLSIVPGVYTKDFDAIKTDGTLSLNGMIKGKYDSINMPGFDLNLEVNNAWFQYPDLPSKIDKIAIKINANREEGPDLDNLKVNIDKFYFEFLKNKVDISLKLEDVMSDPDIDSRIQSYLDLSQLGQVMPLTEGEQYSGIITSDIILKGRMSAIEKEQYENFQAKGDLKINKLIYNSPAFGFPMTVDSLLFKFSPQSLNLAFLEAKFGESDISVNGNLTNYLAYYLRGETLIGDLNLNSNYLNLDQLLGTTTTTETSADETVSAEENTSTSTGEVFQVPSNIDFIMNTSIKKVLYDKMELRNMGGTVEIKEEKANAKNLRMDIFEGTILMNGSYKALSMNEASVNFDYDIKNIDIPTSYNYFNTIEKYAPIAKYCEGKFSTSLSMETKINGNYEPIYESLTGKGNIKTAKVTVKNVPTFVKIAEIIKIDALKEQSFSNLDLSFEFKEGKVWLKETPLKMGTIDAKISGTTSFKQELDYLMVLNIPQKAFGSNATSVISGLLGNVSSQTGLNVTIPEVIPVKINIGGTSTKPEIKTDLKGQGKDAAANVVDQAKEIIKDKLSDEAKKILADAQIQADKILAEAKVQADKIRTEAEIQAKKIEDEGKKAGEKIRQESIKQGEKIKAEEYKVSQSLVDQATNPIAKKAAEKLATESKIKTDKKVEDLIKKANDEATKVETTANNSATKVRTEANEKATAVETTGKNQSDAVLKTANDKVDKMAK